MEFCIYGIISPCSFSKWGFINQKLALHHEGGNLVSACNTQIVVVFVAPIICRNAWFWSSLTLLDGISLRYHIALLRNAYYYRIAQVTGSPSIERMINFGNIQCLEALVFHILLFDFYVKQESSLRLKYLMKDYTGINLPWWQLWVCDILKGRRVNMTEQLLFVERCKWSLSNSSCTDCMVVANVSVTTKAWWWAKYMTKSSAKESMVAGVWISISFDTRRLKRVRQSEEYCGSPSNMNRMMWEICVAVKMSFLGDNNLNKKFKTRVFNIFLEVGTWTLSQVDCIFKTTSLSKCFLMKVEWISPTGVVRQSTELHFNRKPKELCSSHSSELDGYWLIFLYKKKEL